MPALISHDSDKVSLTVGQAVSQDGRPIRRCIVCREPAPRQQLLRVVRCPDGEVKLAAQDPGRGAYIHRQADCLTIAASVPKHLARALRQTPPDDILDQLDQIAGASPH